VERNDRRRLKYNGNKRNRQAVNRDHRQCGKIGVGGRSPQRTVGIEKKEEEEQEEEEEEEKEEEEKEEEEEEEQQEKKKKKKKTMMMMMMNKHMNMNMNMNIAAHCLTVCER
jgi:archaellum component FlaD/FlaE